MVFLKKKANVHPLVTIFGIILGLSLFGFWGIIFGTLIISVFMLLMKIYRKEFITN
jgi:predicted PurR-regulated permease PerM